jgi:rod shape-determining protein MreD
MKIIWLILISILAVALQLTVFSKMAVLGAGPNLILAGVLAYAIFKEEQKGGWLILIPAFILDFLVGRPFGILTLSLWLMFFLIDWLAKVLFKKSDLPAVFILVFLGVLFFEFCFLLLSQMAAIFHLSQKLSLSGFYFYATLPLNIIYNGLFCLFFIWLFNKSRIFLSRRF